MRGIEILNQLLPGRTPVEDILQAYRVQRRLIASLAWECPRNRDCPSICTPCAHIQIMASYQRRLPEGFWLSNDWEKEVNNEQGI